MRSEDNLRNVMVQKIQIFGSLTVLNFLSKNSPSDNLLALPFDAFVLPVMLVPQPDNQIGVVISNVSKSG